MVIQRRRTSTGFGGGVPAIAPLESTNQISSSEDSNDDVENVSWEAQATAEDCQALLRGLNERLAKSQVSEKGVIGSLELLRVNLQSSFDAEVAQVVNDYREKFFSKAMKNLRGNLGESAVSESDLLLVLQKMVQQSALQFSAPKPSPAPPSKLLFSPATTSSNPGPLFDLSDSEGSQDTIHTSLPMFNTTFQKYWRGSTCPSGEQVAVGGGQQKRKRPPLQGDGHSAKAVKKPSPPSTTSFDILHSTLTRSSTSSSKVTWNTSALTKDTQFVLDSQANKLFPGGEDLTNKHPQLICYAPDNQEDLNWLANERIIPATQRNHCNVKLLVREEVIKLKQQMDPEWSSASFMGFKVPDFIMRKMHKYFTELSIRNQKIRTTSGYFDTVTSVHQRDNSSGDGCRSNRSHLSSSHATLSALLANCSDGQDN